MSRLVSRLRRFAISFVVAVVPAGLPRTYLLWAFGMPPVAGGEDPPTEAQIAEWRRKAELYDPDRRYTEDDLNRMVQDRLARDRRDRPTDAQVTEWKEKAERYDEAVNAGRTEVEREKTAREQAERERDEAKQAAEDATKGAQQTLRRSKIVEVATKAGAISPDEVHTLLEGNDFTVKAKAEDGNEKEFKVTIGDDGQVTGVEDAVKAFLGDRKHLVGDGPKPDWDAGPRKPAPKSDDVPSDPKAVREWASKQRS